MTFLVGWGRNAGSARVTTPADLDRVLDGIEPAPGGLPYSVSVVLPDGSDLPPLLEILIGHPERSFAFHVGADGTSGWAYQPELEPVDSFVFDYAGVATDTWPERTRVSITAAREAARRFVSTAGHRPDNLSWDDDSDE